MIRMTQVANLDSLVYLFQCSECKSITQTMANTYTIPECDCEEKLLEEYLGKNYKEELRV